MEGGTGNLGREGGREGERARRVRGKWGVNREFNEADSINSERTEVLQPLVILSLLILQITMTISGNLSQVYSVSIATYSTVDYTNKWSIS